MSHKELAKNILSDIGGSENIISVTHCMTRLRFILKDVKKADTPHLREVRGVLGVLMSGDYYMVVIGKEVSAVYNELKDILYGKEVKRPKAARSSRLGGIKLLVVLSFILSLSSVAAAIISIWGVVSLDPKITSTLSAVAGLSVYLLPLIFMKLLNQQKDSEIQRTSLPIYSPAKGRVLRLSDHPDSAFSDSVYGEGAVIIPETNLLVSPVNGRIENIAHTLNSVTLISDDGTELLLHINTGESLRKEFLRPFIEGGERVRIGDPLLEYEKNALELEGIKPIIAVIVTNCDIYNSIRILSDNVYEQQPFIEIIH